MATVLVFDPAMCCSSGVCGPSVDPQLARFAADLEWLASQGVTVARFNLAQQPSVFAQDAAVKQALEVLGESALPLVKVDGSVKSTGLYPSREALASWTSVGEPKKSCCGPAAKTARAVDPAATDCCGPAAAGSSAKPTKSCC